jgi:phosphate transport system permease protein
VSDDKILPAGETRPAWAVVVERLAWGRFYGTPKTFLVDGRATATAPAAVWAEFERHHAQTRTRWRARRDLEKMDTGRVNARIERERLRLREVELRAGRASDAYRAATAGYAAIEAGLQKEFQRIRSAIEALDRENARYQMVMTTADGRDKTIGLADIVLAYPANRLGTGGKARICALRWWEFLSDEPREANSEGGVWPAIFGTVVMTLLMAVVVAPFGVLAALYLREYARAGAMVSAVRIAINNLAGVPSIVFGVFGLGFFSYTLGASIDQWLFAAKLPNPTFGTGGVLWASMTLALLTLPVVIVATEEALSAVPSSMREGSYACGASKWQTIRRIVLPRAMPGVMTGMILAMARGAGEVAPLMLVGAVKLAPELPVSGTFPYVHLERSFMHLGFHIYDLGFQSQNSEASKPMVFTTTLLLILIILLLNLAGVYIRQRLRRRFVSASF